MWRPQARSGQFNPDTVSRVIQPAARRACENSPQPTVNNSAATNNLRPGKQLAGRIAPDGSRSFNPSLVKAHQSLPVRPVAAVKMSERTLAREAPCIRMTHDGAAVRATGKRTMKSWNEITHYAGFGGYH